jgi:hypothetical protein
MHLVYLLDRHFVFNGCCASTHIEDECKSSLEINGYVGRRVYRVDGSIPAVGSASDSWGIAKAVIFAVGFFFAIALGIYPIWSILRSGRD